MINIIIDSNTNVQYFAEGRGWKKGNNTPLSGRAKLIILKILRRLTQFFFTRVESKTYKNGRAKKKK